MSAFIGAGQHLIGEMTKYGIGGVQKVQTCLGEILGETATQLAFSTARIAATMPRATTRRATGGRRARTVVGAGAAIDALSKPQQTVLNAFGVGEQIPLSTIAQRTGMQPAGVMRTTNALKRKNYLAAQGRGKNALFWKIQAAQQVAA